MCRVYLENEDHCPPTPECHANRAALADSLRGRPDCRHGHYAHSCPMCPKHQPPSPRSSRRSAGGRRQLPPFRQPGTHSADQTSGTDSSPPAPLGHRLRAPSLPRPVQTPPISGVRSRSPASEATRSTSSASKQESLRWSGAWNTLGPDASALSGRLLHPAPVPADHGPLKKSSPSSLP
jgi:hypothetical protein